LFIKSADIKTAGFTYDLVDVTRQVMANYALPLQQQWIKAYKAKDSTAFRNTSSAFLQLIEDMDRLLATKKDLMLGPWLSDAKRWGTTPQEKALYERNARDLITLWGDAESPLHEYSNRQWSGLLHDFYKARWQQFFVLLNKSLQTDTTPDLKTFEKTISQWEWKWVNQQKSFPVTVSGNPATVSKEMYNKYHKLIESAYE
jgi:alpha-N-acetylglucosaminidase